MEERFDTNADIYEVCIEVTSIDTFNSINGPIVFSSHLLDISGNGITSDNAYGTDFYGQAASESNGTYRGQYILTQAEQDALMAGMTFGSHASSHTSISGPGLTTRVDELGTSSGYSSTFGVGLCMTTASAPGVDSGASVNWGYTASGSMEIIAQASDLTGADYTGPLDVAFYGVDFTLLQKSNPSGRVTTGVLQIGAAYYYGNTIITGRGQNPNNPFIYGSQDIRNTVIGNCAVARGKQDFYIGLPTDAWFLAHYTAQTWPVFTLQQAAIRRLYGNGDTLGSPTVAAGRAWVIGITDWWPIQNQGPTMSVVAGIFRLVGDATRTTYMTDERATGAMGYRYLRVRLRCVGGDKKVLTLGTLAVGNAGAGRNRFLLTCGADGEWVEREIDLLVPSVPASTADAATVVHYQSIPIPFDLQIEVPPGCTFEIAHIDGFRKFASQVTVRALTKMLNFAQQLIMGYTDGLYTLREVGLHDYGGPNLVDYTTVDVIERINANEPFNGWSATDLCPRSGTNRPITKTGDTLDSKYFRDSNTMIFNLQSRGIMGDGSVYRDQPTGMPIKAQVAPFQVKWFPGCGDIMGAGAYSSSTTLLFRQYFGAEFAGIVLNADGTTPVTLTQKSTGANRGSILPRATDGFFVTPPPFTKDLAGSNNSHPGEPDTHILRLGTDVTQQITLNSDNGRRAHVMMYGKGKTTGHRVATIAHPHMGWWGRASVLSDGSRLDFQRTTGAYNTRADLLPSAPIFSAGVGETLSHPALEIDPGHPGERVVCLFAKANADKTTDALETSSADDGATWSTPIMAFAGGAMPVIARGVDGGGGLLRTAFIAGSPGDSRGTLMGNFQNPGDSVPGAAFTLNQSVGGVTVPIAVQNSGHHIVQAHEGRARWLLTCTVAGETDPSDWASADEGQTWTRFA